jgi:hypothetical protein
MKNLFNLMLILFIGAFSVTTASAQKAKKVNMKKPDKVALAFMQRFTELDFKSSRELMTKESHSLLDLMEMAMSMSSEEDMAKAKTEAKEGAKNLKKATCKVDKNDATCTFCCDQNNQPMEGEGIKLKKVDGKWYVHMSKEDMMDESMEEPIIEEGE